MAAASVLERMLRRTRVAVTGEKISIFLWPMACACGDGLPCVLRPYIDRVFLNALAVIEPLHGECAVEGDGCGKVDFKLGVMGARGRGPESIRVAVERRRRFQMRLARAAERDCAHSARAGPCRILPGGRRRYRAAGHDGREPGRASTARRGRRFHRKW